MSNKINSNADFKTRVKNAMDLIMYKSVCKHMAVAACAVSPADAINMLSYINENL